MGSQSGDSTVPVLDEAVRSITAAWWIKADSSVYLFLHRLPVSALPVSLHIFIISFSSVFSPARM